VTATLVLPNTGFYYSFVEKYETLLIEFSCIVQKVRIDSLVNFSLYFGLTLITNGQLQLRMYQIRI
jgi:hypothetical protein